MTKFLKTISIIIVSALVLTSCGKKGDDPTPTKTNQTISFGTIPSKSVGDALTLTATASSGLAVTYTSNNPTVATVTSTGVVTIITEGTVTFTATQSGNTAFNSATATQTLTVGPHVYKDMSINPTYIYIYSDGTAFYNSDRTNPVGDLYTFVSPTFTKTSAADIFTNNSIGICTISSSNADTVPFSPNVGALTFLKQ